MRKLIILCFFALFLLNKAFGQCNCTNTSQFVPSVHWLGTADRSLTPKKNLRFGFLYRFTSSNKEFEKDHPTISSINFTSHIAGFFISFGIDYFTSIEADIGYSYRKLEQFDILKSISYGFSNFSIGVRRNIYESDNSSFVVNIGGGVKIPLIQLRNPDITPVVLQPSNGAFGTYFLLFGQSSQSKWFNLAFQSRLDYNFPSAFSYQFAPMFLNSIAASSEIIENLYLLLETRALVQFQDKDSGAKVENSGSFLVYAVPQIVYRFSDFSISILAELPFYRYYNGRQIAEMPSLSLFFNWVINFNRRRL